MTREEFKTLVKGMKAVYAQPTFIPDQDAFNVWFELLKDIPYQQANVAIQKYMLTEKFPPTIADIREKATQIVESVDSSMSELEAWSLVRKAVRNSGYHSVEEFEKLPEACQRAVGSAANLKEWALMDSERVETVEQSHFIRNYRTTVQRISEEKKLPESIRLLIASMRDNALELEKKEQPALEVKKQEEEKTDSEPGMSEETRAKFQQVMRNLQGKMRHGGEVTYGYGRNRSEYPELQDRKKYDDRGPGKSNRQEPVGGSGL